LIFFFEPELDLFVASFEKSCWASSSLLDIELEKLWLSSLPFLALASRFFWIFSSLIF